MYKREVIAWLHANQQVRCSSLASVTDRIAATMELDTRAILLLPLVLAVLLHPAAANDSTPRRSGGLSLRLVPSAGWNSTMHVDSDGFLHLDEATTTALRPHVHGPRGLTYSLAITAGTGHGRRTYDLELDTASSLTWMQCVPISHPFTQMPPPFNPVASRTFRHVSRQSTMCDGPFTRAECEFSTTRLNGAHVSGVLGNDTFAFKDALVPGVVFGCAHTTAGFHNHGVLAGVLGLRKQRPSLIWTQLHQHGHGGRFSYCLFGPGHPNRHGFLRFGADIPAIGHMRSTSILYMRLTTEPDFSLYFVCLTGVSVAEQRLRLPGGWIRELFQRHRSGDGRWSSGCVIDPGTGTMVMIKPAYDLLVHAMEKHVRRLGLLKVERDRYPVCFRGATRAAFQLLPTVTLHMDNDLVLRPQQLFVLIQQDACLTVMPSDHITIIGAMQQVDMRFVYDIAAGKIHFAPEKCSDDTGGQN